MMIRCVPVLIWFALTLPSAVQAVEFTVQPDVFTPDILAEPAEDVTLYGSLEGWPHTYVFSIATTTSVRYQLGVPQESEAVSLLLVREEERGVSEAARVTNTAVDWEETRDGRIGVLLRETQPAEVTLMPGVYRLEISNAVNTGKYQLQIGEGSRTSFFGSLRDAFVVHAFYGSWTGALTNWRFVVLVVVLAGLYWLLRRRS